MLAGTYRALLFQLQPDRTGWALSVLVSDDPARTPWPSAEWGTVGPPNTHQRAVALREMGYAPADGAAWKWGEREAGEGHLAQTTLNASTTVVQVPPA